MNLAIHLMSLIFHPFQMLLFCFVIPGFGFEFEISLKIAQPFAEILDGLDVLIFMEK